MPERVTPLPPAEARAQWLAAVTHRMPTVPAEEATALALRGLPVVVGDVPHAPDEAPVVPSGTLLRPQEIGALLALGMGAAGEPLLARQHPRVAIFTVGNDLVPPEETPGPGQARDVNSYTISALVARAGGMPDRRGIVPEAPDLLLGTVRLALAPPGAADMIIVAGGSSAEVLDQLAEEFGGPGVLAWGVALNPGGATVLAVLDGKPVLGLPADPAAALIAGQWFGIPAVQRLLGMRPPVQPRVTATLTADVPGTPDGMRVVPCALREDGAALLADPLRDAAGSLAALVQADGLITVPVGMPNLKAGTLITVMFF